MTVTVLVLATGLVVVTGLVLVVVTGLVLVLLVVHVTVLVVVHVTGLVVDGARARDPARPNHHGHRLVTEVDELRGAGYAAVARRIRPGSSPTATAPPRGDYPVTRSGLRTSEEGKAQ